MCFPKMAKYWTKAFLVNLFVLSFAINSFGEEPLRNEGPAFSAYVQTLASLTDLAVELEQELRSLGEELGEVSRNRKTTEEYDALKRKVADLQANTSRFESFLTDEMKVPDFQDPQIRPLAVNGLQMLRELVGLLVKGADNLGSLSKAIDSSDREATETALIAKFRIMNDILEKQNAGILFQLGFIPENQPERAYALLSMDYNRFLIIIHKNAWMNLDPAKFVESLNEVIGLSTENLKNGRELLKQFICEYEKYEINSEERRIAINYLRSISENLGRSFDLDSRLIDAMTRYAEIMQEKQTSSGLTRSLIAAARVAMGDFDTIREKRDQLKKDRISLTADHRAKMDSLETTDQIEN